MPAGIAVNVFEAKANRKRQLKQQLYTNKRG
jgi:hypothetical protein